MYEQASSTRYAPTPPAPQWRQIPAPIFDAIHVGSGAWLLTATSVLCSDSALNRGDTGEGDSM